MIGLDYVENTPTSFFCIKNKKGFCEESFYFEFKNENMTIYDIKQNKDDGYTNENGKIIKNNNQSLISISSNFILD